MRGSAPPSGAMTMPVRAVATRRPRSRAFKASASQATQTSARKVDAGAESSNRSSSPGLRRNPPPRQPPARLAVSAGTSGCLPDSACPRHGSPGSLASWPPSSGPRLPVRPPGGRSHPLPRTLRRAAVRYPAARQRRSRPRAWRVRGRISTQHRGSVELANQSATHQPCRSRDERLHRNLLT